MRGFFCPFPGNVIHQNDVLLHDTQNEICRMDYTLCLPNVILLTIFEMAFRVKLL